MYSYRVNIWWLSHPPKIMEVNSREHHLVTDGTKKGAWNQPKSDVERWASHHDPAIAQNKATLC